jgi:internalin A
MSDKSETKGLKILGKIDMTSLYTSEKIQYDQIGSADSLNRRNVQSPTVQVSIEKAKSGKRKRLKLIGRGLKNFPMELLELENLEMLDLSNNRISNVPKEITRLKKLKTLILRNNRIKNLPEEIADLENLTHLVLGGNQMSSLPLRFSMLRNLKELHLSGNKLSEIPECIFYLENLQTLWLASNKIDIIPNKINQLERLKTLYIQNNYIQEIPESLIRMGGLYSIFLQGNPMYYIPLYDWAGNRLIDLRTYFDSLEDGSEKSYTAKLIFVGKGGEGKTTLRERLVNPNISIEELKKIAITERVEVKKLNNIYAEDDKYYDISMWDFGGQEIMRNIHHLFLTDAALYLLLWSSRIAQNKVAYFKEWLSVINAENPQSHVKVILVNNRAREKGSTTEPINQQLLTKLFPNLVDFIDISALEGTGIDHLQEKIKKHLSSLPTVKKVSSNWISVKFRLEKEAEKSDKKFIKKDDFIKICSNNKISERSEEIDQLLDWLHHIGAIIWYKNVQGLESTIFFNPEWVSNHVNRILIDQEGRIRENQGKLVFNEFVKESLIPSDELDKIIQLMECFNLCFELDKKSRTYIIPLLLPEKEPSKKNFTEWEALLHESPKGRSKVVLLKVAITNAQLRPMAKIQPSQQLPSRQRKKPGIG